MNILNGQTLSFLLDEYYRGLGGKEKANETRSTLVGYERERKTLKGSLVITRRSNQSQFCPCPWPKAEHYE